MLTKCTKYKTLLIVGFLSAYLIGAFQRPALEALHTISHIAHQLLTPPSSEVYFHSHEGHRHAHIGQEQEQHQHPLISFFDKILDDFSDDQPAQQHKKRQLKKKNPELLSSALSSDTPATPQPHVLFLYRKLISDSIPIVPTPPPRV